MRKLRRPYHDHYENPALINVAGMKGNARHVGCSGAADPWHKKAAGRDACAQPM